MDPRVAVVGLGYVGLPVAVALSRRFPGTIGFDLSQSRISTLSSGIDVNGDIPAEELAGCGICLTTEIDDLKGCDFFVVAVPTPIDRDKRPDLSALLLASELVGSVLSRGSVVVYESTVYPGVTEEICGPVLARASGLRQGEDFGLGYSPERINPGDREHALQRVIKVVSAETAELLDYVAWVYGEIIPAGVHRAPSIKVAEAAKVIENTQRDLNIALMNELAIIFDRMHISTRDVLAAASTKWNFLRFAPGLVGGHCIGVDPYYLTNKAEQLGYHPEVILAGRRINDGMGHYVAQRVVKIMSNSGFQIRGARVGIMGMTFKENISDLRNSRVPEIVAEFREFGIEPMVCDPMVDSAQVRDEYAIELVDVGQLHSLHALILAVSHRQFLALPVSGLAEKIVAGGVFADVKAVVDAALLRPDVIYWSL